MIIALHGFLGSGGDFDFLKDQFDVYSPDLDGFVGGNLEELREEIDSHLESDNILIGYSFGARLAMDIFLTNPSAYTKVIFLAGHAGLQSDIERSQRKKIEAVFIDEIENRDFSSFIEYWNQLELFKGDKPIDPEIIDMQTLKGYFESFPLSAQPFYRDALLEHKSKIKWYFGGDDLKYRAYAEDNLSEFELEIIKDCSHRLIKNLETQKKVIEDIESCLKNS